MVKERNGVAVTEQQAQFIANMANKLSWPEERCVGALVGLAIEAESRRHMEAGAALEDFKKTTPDTPEALAAWERYSHVIFG